MTVSVDGLKIGNTREPTMVGAGYKCGDTRNE